MERATFADWAAHTLLHLEPSTHPSGTIELFVFEAPKVLMLLLLVVFGVGVIRSFFTPERTRRILAGQQESVRRRSSGTRWRPRASRRRW
jgi:uncharacterized membrane protein YraQ (UPF0718 family)